VTVEIYNIDNMEYQSPRKYNLCYADCIYDNPDFGWITKYWDFLLPNGIFMVQCDDALQAEIKMFILRLMSDATWVNTLIYKQEWGGVPRNKFPQKHDYIHVFCKGNDWKWHPDRIQIPKVTAGTNLDKKGTGLKTPCSVFDDLGNFSTISKERIKTDDGHNIQWQKPIKLMDRLLLPFTDEDDWIVDPFLGSGTTGVWSLKNNRNFVGIELEQDVFEIAKSRLEDERKILYE
jgi:DNA modification methylase